MSYFLEKLRKKYDTVKKYDTEKSTTLEKYDSEPTQNLVFIDPYFEKYLVFRKKSIFNRWL